MAGNFDDIEVDINELFDSTYDFPKPQKPGYIKRLFNRYFFGLLIKLRLYTRLVDNGFLRSWFEEFKHYWSLVLDGRPLFFHDFHFLLGVYRQKFQNLETPDNASTKEFLDSWQTDTLYLLFGAVRLYAYHPLTFYKLEKWISNGDDVLEYGCGIAPITYYLTNYGLKRDLDFSIADIRQINSHFARERLGKSVNFIEIEPYINPLVGKKFNVIFMITVMEHLPDPLQTVQNITSSLNQDGIFIFDYILGDGDGHDTIEAVDQRGEVLKFINKNYYVLSGALTESVSMGTTVCRLK